MHVHFWFVNWIDSNSFYFIDEIENCISVYSQEYLMDYLAYIYLQKSILDIIIYSLLNTF